MIEKYWKKTKIIEINKPVIKRSTKIVSSLQKEIKAMKYDNPNQPYITLFLRKKPSVSYSPSITLHIKESSIYASSSKSVCQCAWRYDECASKPNSHKIPIDTAKQWVIFKWDVLQQNRGSTHNFRKWHWLEQKRAKVKSISQQDIRFGLCTTHECQFNSKIFLKDWSMHYSLNFLKLTQNDCFGEQLVTYFLIL